MVHGQPGPSTRPLISSVMTIVSPVYDLLDEYPALVMVMNGPVSRQLNTSPLTRPSIDAIGPPSGPCTSPRTFPPFCWRTHRIVRSIRDPSTRNGPGWPPLPSPPPPTPPAASRATACAATRCRSRSSASRVEGRICSGVWPAESSPTLTGFPERAQRVIAESGCWLSLAYHLPGDYSNNAIPLAFRKLMPWHGFC